MAADTDIATLRSWLMRLDAWPAAGDEFLALMPQSSWYSPQPNRHDLALLPSVARDAAAGADIGAQYPAFFQKLLAHGSLRQAFVAELERRAV